MVFYFSGTGNTAWAAKQIATALKEPLINMADVPAETTYTLEQEERIGFCFPVHGWRPPLLVRHFIRKMKFTNASTHYCYALCTAGDTVGEAMDIFEKDLLEIGLKAESTFSLIMPESYVGLPFMDVDPIDKERSKKEQASKNLQQYISSITNREQGIRNLVIGRWPRINSRIIGAAFVKWIISDKPFHVIDNRCTQCGLCATICPVHDIDGGRGQCPSWKHNGQCLTCFSCYHHCRTHAIEFGRQTHYKGQYFFERNK